MFLNKNDNKNVLKCVGRTKEENFQTCYITSFTNDDSTFMNYLNIFTFILDLAGRSWRDEQDSGTF